MNGSASKNGGAIRHGAGNTGTNNGRGQAIAIEIPAGMMDI
ncbi:MAG TPA: hypothetical protein VF793_14250 [Telluria sp.]|jgi:hypothetical protein